MRQKTQKKVIIIAFLAVPVLLLLAFTYLPLADMFKYSFWKWNGTSKDHTFIGLDNYKTIFGRSEYLNVLKTSIYYFVGSVLQIIIALYFATILNYKVRGGNFFKGVIFFPSLLNGVAVGLLFNYFYKGGGTLDTVLTFMGVPESSLKLWLGDAAIVNFSLVFVSLWRYMGQNMIMFNGAIKSVSGELLEAASIDGANTWQQFRFIVLPNIKTIVSLNLILAVKGAISVFEIPMIMTDGQNGSRTFVMKMLDTAFDSRKYGLACALGVVLFLFIMSITFVQKRLFERKESDEMVIYKQKAVHLNDNKEEVVFEMDEESDGSIRLLDFIPMLIDLSLNNRVYLIDEIDRSMHPLLSQKLLEYYYSNLRSGLDTQLIFTTHEASLLNSNSIRHDEIWFVEKDIAGASHFTSLVEYKPRQDVLKGYMHGRYGAIPFFQTSAIS